jgi:heme-degrading monooxygenase HmoA
MDFIVVVTFETTPDKHVEALQVLDEYIDRFLSIQPGFIESSLNEREDGHGYLHFARWENEADFRAFAEKAKNHPLLPKIRQFDASASFYQAVRHYTGAVIN